MVSQKKEKKPVDNTYRISIVQYFSLYAKETCINAFGVCLSFLFLWAVVGGTAPFHFMMVSGVFLLYQAGVLCFLLLRKPPKDKKERWIAYINVGGMLVFMMFMQPQTFHDWMAVVLLGSVVAPFCLEIRSSLKDIELFYDLSKSAKKEMMDSIEGIQRKIDK